MKNIFLSVLLISSLCFSGCQNDSSNNKSALDSNADSAKKLTSNENGFGIITGSISYPTDAGFPADYKIALLDVSTGKATTMDSTDVDFKNYKYQTKVKAGRYIVYSYLASDPDQKAFYNEFVTCGLKADCPSHKVIIVEVKPGETKTNIDPGDWYQITK